MKNEDESQNLDFASILIRPVQRIPRYILLLEEILKGTNKSHLDFNKLKEALSKSSSTNRSRSNLFRKNEMYSGQNQHCEETEAIKTTCYSTGENHHWSSKLCKYFSQDPPKKQRLICIRWVCPQTSEISFQNTKCCSSKTRTSCQSPCWYSPIVCWSRETCPIREWNSSPCSMCCIPNLERAPPLMVSTSIYTTVD